MFTKFRTNEKGFTLIELLIVVAIIGILAAIAIPQFAQYRIRGYNSAAQADLRNLGTAEEAFFADWQVYASTAALGVPGAGVLTTGPQTVSIAVAAASISATQPTAATTFQFGLSSNVNILIATEALGASYTAMTKHTSGDRYYGADSAPAGSYVSTGAAVACTGAAGDEGVPTAAAADLVGVTPAGCAGASAWAAI